MAICVVGHETAETICFILSFNYISTSPMRIAAHSISDLMPDSVGVLLNLPISFEFAILIYRSTIAPLLTFTPDEE